MSFDALIFFDENSFGSMYDAVRVRVLESLCVNAFVMGSVHHNDDDDDDDDDISTTFRKRADAD